MGVVKRLIDENERRIHEDRRRLASLAKRERPLRVEPSPGRGWDIAQRRRPRAALSTSPPPARRPIAAFPRDEILARRRSFSRRAGALPHRGRSCPAPTPGEIVGAIANEAASRASSSARSHLFDEFSTVRLPANLPGDLLAALKRTRVRQMPLSIRRLERRREATSVPRTPPPGTPDAARKASARRTANAARATSVARALTKQPSGFTSGAKPGGGAFAAQPASTARRRRPRPPTARLVALPRRQNARAGVPASPSRRREDTNAGRGRVPGARPAGRTCVPTPPIACRRPPGRPKMGGYQMALPRCVTKRSPPVEDSLARRRLVRCVSAGASRPDSGGHPVLMRRLVSTVVLLWSHKAAWISAGRISISASIRRVQDAHPARPRGSLRGLPEKSWTASRIACARSTTPDSNMPSPPARSNCC